MEISRANYFKIKNKFLIITIVRKVFSVLMIISLTILLAFAILITFMEQNENYNNFFIINRDSLSLIIRWIVIIPTSIFLILFIIDKIIHKRLSSMKKDLGVIDDI